jgi:Bacterial archaeo-eukaryotic release factor family 3
MGAHPLAAPAGRTDGSRPPHRQRPVVPTHPVALDRDLLGRLQRARAYPSVSMLLTTTPAAAMTRRDLLGLDRLVRVALRRIAAEPADDATARITDRLRRLVGVVRHAATSNGLALFVSDAEAHVVRLPVPVRDRVVVDPTFATRDLAAALTRHPRFRLLVLSERRARLLEGWPDLLHDVLTHGFPVRAPARLDCHDRRQFSLEPARRRDADLRRHFRTVDTALTLRSRRDPLPVVIAGIGRQLALFAEGSGSDHLVVGTLRGAFERFPAARLAVLARPVLDAHRDTTRQAALARLVTTPPARLAHGPTDVWNAARHGHLELLCVEEGLHLPARVAAGGRLLLPADDVEHPEVLDDSIDEIIEFVALSGGRTVFMENGQLAGHDHIVGLLRTDRR